MRVFCSDAHPSFDPSVPFQQLLDAPWPWSPNYVNASTASSSKKNSGGLSGALIAAIVVPCVVVLVAACCVFMCLKSQHKKQMKVKPNKSPEVRALARPVLKGSGGAMVHASVRVGPRQPTGTSLAPLPNAAPQPPSVFAIPQNYPPQRQPARPGYYPNQAQGGYYGVGPAPYSHPQQQPGMNQYGIMDVPQVPMYPPPNYANAAAYPPMYKGRGSDDDDDVEKTTKTRKRKSSEKSSKLIRENAVDVTQSARVRQPIQPGQGTSTFTASFSNVVNALTHPKPLKSSNVFGTSSFSGQPTEQERFELARVRLKWQSAMIPEPATYLSPSEWKAKRRSQINGPSF